MMNALARSTPVTLAAIRTVIAARVTGVERASAFIIRLTPAPALSLIHI